jgi:ElaB/YqjD/DUF883 family membrane-anchored ribosome-binding protein
MSQLTQSPIDHGQKQDDVIRSLREMAGHLGKDASDKVAGAASALAHAAADLAEQTKKAAGPVVQKASKEIREHPISTAAILAASVGLIGYALTRDKHER